MTEDGIKILYQQPINVELNFTSAMFPENYEIAYQAQDIDLKIPLLHHKNSTLYLKGIYEANEGSDYLYAAMYFIHDIKSHATGNILSSLLVVNLKEHTSTSSVNVKKDVFSQELGIMQDMVSLRGSGPGDQIWIYIKRDLLEQSKGNFTVYLENLNDLSYAVQQ